MKLDQLHYFSAAARFEHIGKAARTLAISPSAVSHCISALEQELGQLLFVRDGKRMLLTTAGKRLAERAEHLLGEVASLKAELSAVTPGLEGHFRLAGAHGLSSRCLVPAWAQLSQNHAKLCGEIYSLRSAEIVGRVITGELDLGVCFSPQSHPGFETHIINQGQLVIAARKEHPIFKLRPPLRKAQLGRFPMAAPKAYQGIDNCETHPLFTTLGLRPQLQFVFDSYEVGSQYLALSNSFALIPDWVLRWPDSVLQKVLPDQPAAPVTIAAIWPKNRPPVMAMQRLIEAMESLLAD
jgi:DNA-binding transcriptional LysR family regulator